jgi:hypothetical protein
MGRDMERTSVSRYATVLSTGIDLVHFGGALHSVRGDGRYRKQNGGKAYLPLSRQVHLKLMRV